MRKEQSAQPANRVQSSGVAEEQAYRQCPALPAAARRRSLPG
eukprot:CAMPEP_0181527800 /NCGR_PEP_ID=MMETSP1110-20121109/70196_1 /TAXON_ID=174948 /ORGANISM="Symbiodinium sp., Strain CCMP421" /LENGTH=41 /DNA_ID= /DNA_START= /DNA_END= /DNA_ORIENTATION=